MSVNENIKNIRLKLELTLEDLSEKTGISIWSLERYESNQLNIPKINLSKIAKSLDTTIDELFYEPINIEPLIEITQIPKNINEEVKITDKDIQMNIENIDSKTIIEKYNNLSNSNKSKFIDFLDALENS